MSCVAAIPVNVRALLKLRDWTEQRLADEAGIPLDTLRGLLERPGGADLDVLDAVAGALDLWPSWLMLPGLPVELVNRPDEERNRILLEWGMLGEKAPRQ